MRHRFVRLTLPLLASLALTACGASAVRVMTGASLLDVLSAVLS